MPQKRIIKIDGTQIKNPIYFKIDRFNITKSGRVSSGKMIMDLIAKKRKFSFKYEVISRADLQMILSLIDTDRMFFTLEYTDVGGNQNTATVYVGNIPSEFFRLDMGEYWKNVEFDLIEQ